MSYLKQRLAVQCKLAVDFDAFGINADVAQSILVRLGFAIEKIDVASIAQTCLGASYRRGARLCDAPQVFDCSTLVKYCYGRIGWWLPRRAIQQSRAGRKVEGELRAGDLLFTKGWRAYWDDETPQGIGHVGIFAGNDTVIHAANAKLGVIASHVGSFVDNEHYRGAVRVVDDFNSFVTLTIPDRWEDAETPEDIKWIILIHQ